MLKTMPKPATGVVVFVVLLGERRRKDEDEEEEEDLIEKEKRASESVSASVKNKTKQKLLFFFPFDPFSLTLCPLDPNLNQVSSSKQHPLLTQMKVDVTWRRIGRKKRGKRKRRGGCREIPVSKFLGGEKKRNGKNRKTETASLITSIDIQ